MSDREKISVLSGALSHIRELTRRPYMKIVDRSIELGIEHERPATMGEKLLAWSEIQAAASSALRAIEDDT
jgi:hypothetical protein